MLGIKFIIFLKNILSRLIIFIVRLLSLLFKFLFYQVLLKIYYWLFRLKRYEIKEKGTSNVLKQKAIHILAVFLVITVSIFSITTKSQAEVDSEKIKKSIMAKAVSSEFNQLDTEELIEETAEQSNYQESQVVKYLPITDLSIPLNRLNDEVEEITQPKINNNLAVINPQRISLTDNSQSDNLFTERTEIIEYEVQSGDTVSAIAQRFQLNVNTILWANNLSAFSLIKPGNKLIILPTNGVLHNVKSGETISRLAQTYDVAEDQIIEYNNLEGTTLTISQRLIIPGGRRIIPAPVRVATPAPAYTSPNSASSLVAPKEASASNKMVWPTEGFRITQYFSWRHTGLDIGNKTGTPIYAAEAGTIELAGWSNGYGNNIIINHGGGKKTRYAHMSEMFVKVGQEVSDGEHIAAMGSTGWSTGPHLHFEVIINGAKQNPLNYIR